MWGVNGMGAIMQRPSSKDQTTSLMGTFTWPIQISTVDGLHAKHIDAIVDTCAAYTTLPTPLLRDIGVEPVGQRRFLLADGRRIFMEYGEARATIDGESVTTLVVFGEENAPPLLGAYTLEGLALAVDPSSSASSLLT